MLRRFYFDISNNERTIADDEGVEAVDLEQALDDARIVLNQIANELGVASIDSSWTLIIRDQTGAALAHVPMGLFSRPARSTR